MTVTVEISYYPLTEDFKEPVNNFIGKLTGKNITVETGRMSTILSGEYDELMSLLTKSMGDLMERYPSVFNLRISNACPVI
jgi:uncharacterized protein YqgV (UPF0045/DUF77 family)